MKKNKIFATMFACGIILTGGLALAGCNEPTEYTYTFNAVGTTDNVYTNWTYDQESIKVQKGEDCVIEVYFAEGYSAKNLVVTVNEEVIKNQTINNGQLLSSTTQEEVSYNNVTDFRTWRYTVANLTQDTAVSVDMSNCDLAQIEMHLTGDIQNNAKYAILRDDKPEIVTAINSQTITTPIAINNGSFSVPYGKSFFLLLDKDTNTIWENGNNINFCKKMYNEKYLYNGNQSVFYIMSPKEEVTFSGNFRDNNYNPYEYSSELQATLFNIQTPSNLGRISFYWWTDQYVEDSYETVNYDGTTLYYPNLSSNGYRGYTYNYFYIGNKASLAEEDEPVLNSIDLSDDNINLISKDKIYLEVKSYDNAPLTNAQFFLGETSGSKGDNLLDVSDKIVQIEDKTFLIVSKEDVQNYITPVLGSDDQYFNGGMFLFVKIDQEYIEQNMIGFDFVITNNYEEDYDYRRHLQLWQDEYSYLTPSYIDYNGTDQIIYYKKSLLLDNGIYNNQLKLRLGNPIANVYTPRYESATIKLYYENGQLAATQSVEFEDNDENYKIQVVDLSKISDFSEQNVIKIELTYNIKPTDRYAHDISFDNVNVPEKVHLYISSQISKNIADYTEVTANTTGFLINASNPIYYFFTFDADYKDSRELTLSLKNDSGEEVSVTSYYDDLTGSFVYISDTEAYANYATIKGCYLEPSEILFAEITTKSN